MPQSSVLGLMHVMLLKTEPTLKIGIILPGDERKNIKLTCNDSSSYQIETQASIIPSSKTQKVIESNIDDGEVKITQTLVDDECGITVHDVPTGRGFHWENSIDVTLPGNIHMIPHNGNFLLVNEVSLEQYLACVAVSEMSSECPPAFLEAQTIAARSWIIAGAEQKHNELGIDACNDDCCQRFQGINHITDNSRSICDKTAGMFLLYGGNVCDARYSKSCGGLSENAENVWAIDHVPYLSSIYDGPARKDEIDWQNWFSQEQDVFCGPNYVNESDLYHYLGYVDKEGNYFRWSVKFSQEEFCDFFSNKIGELVNQINKIDVLNRGRSGRINKLYMYYQLENGSIKTHQINNEYEIRKTLHPSFLYSSCFTISIDNENIKFNGAGWGHGVGLCQIGALGMALNGYSTQEILKHYYKNTELKKLY